MERIEETYKAHSAKTKAVCFDDGSEKGKWNPVTDAVLSILEKGFMHKGDKVEVSKGEDGTVIFIKSLSTDNFKKNYKEKNQSQYGYDPARQDQIMRQSAMKMVVDLVTGNKIEFIAADMERFANGLVEYFKTGKLGAEK